MANEISRNIKVGIVVICSTFLMVGALYIIGNKQNLFGSTFRVGANFFNVNGLMPGNNVRLSGIDIGTVEHVEILSDSMVHVTLLIEKDARRFIRKNAVASIGTDGLMGNRLVNITPAKGNAPIIADDDILATQRAVETDDMLHTLKSTNENIKDITVDLKKITQKLNAPNTVWNILSDTTVSDNVKNAVADLYIASMNTSKAAADFRLLVENVKSGKGSVGAIIQDTSLYYKLNASMVKLQQVTSSASVMADNLALMTEKAKRGEGVAGSLLTDTAMAGQLKRSMDNIEKGTQAFSEDMQALQDNVLLRGYFKKKKKGQKK